MEIGLTLAFFGVQMASQIHIQMAGEPATLPLRSSLSCEALGLLPGVEPLRRRSRRQRPPSSIGGAHASFKALGPAHFESLLEKDAQTLLTADPAVKQYAVQCHQLTYWTPGPSGGSWRRYTPDLVVEMRDGRRVVVEVKAAALAAMDKWTRLEGHIRRAYREDHDVEFVVLTEAVVRRQPHLANAEIMISHAGTVAPDAEFCLLGTLEEEQGQISIKALSQVLVQLGLTYAETFSAVMKCALAGKVEVERDRAFSPATLVRLA